MTDTTISGASKNTAENTAQKTEKKTRGAVLYERMNKVERRGQTVAGALMEWGRPDREYVAVQAGVPYEGIEDRDLAKLISSEVTSKDGMRKLLLLASDEEIAAFEKAIDAGAFVPDAAMSEHLAIFSALGYISMYKDGTQEVNVDAARAYLLYCTPDFQLMRQQCGWLGTCIDAMFHIHGACPKKTLLLMFKRRYKEADMDTFLETFFTIPKEYRFCDIVDGRFIYRSLENDQYFRDLGKDNKPYFIPTLEEIEDMAAHGYPSGSVSYQRVFSFLGDTLKQSDEKKEDLLAQICRGLRMRHTPEWVIRYLKEDGLSLDKSQEAKLLKLLEDAAEDTRCPVLRGFTPMEEARHNEVQPVKYK